MEDESLRLRAIIVYLITMLKSNFELSARISADLAAVTESVRGLDPTFEDVLARNRQDENESGDPAIREMLNKYDEVIERVNRGDFV